VVSALAAEQPEAAEGVAVQPDRRLQVGQGVGVAGHRLLGQLDLGEADHRMGPLPVWPGKAELAGQLSRDAGCEPVWVGGLDQARALEDHLGLVVAATQAGLGPFFWCYAKPGEL
jgi:hypothetical protein